MVPIGSRHPKMTTRMIPVEGPGRSFRAFACLDTSKLLNDGEMMVKRCLNKYHYAQSGGTDWRVNLPQLKRTGTSKPVVPYSVGRSVQNTPPLGKASGPVVETGQSTQQPVVGAGKRKRPTPFESSFR